MDRERSDRSLFEAAHMTRIASILIVIASVAVCSYWQYVRAYWIGILSGAQQGQHSSTATGVHTSRQRCATR